MRRALSVFVAVFVLLPSLCWGWGREGHRIIATVAEDHLNETTKIMIQSLIVTTTCIPSPPGRMTFARNAGRPGHGIT